MVMDLEIAQRQCDECGRTVPKIKRVEQGRHYCATCYARCFKHRTCPGCGGLSRLLVNDPAAQCRKCVAARPCIRCQRSGRALGLLLPQGPVCNACYMYFREPQRCSVCSQLVRQYSRMGEDQAVVCDRCSSSDKTCRVCRRHRPCIPRSDGSWVCSRCESHPYTACQVCNAPVEPGRNGRCEACYWKGRCEICRSQLSELLHGESVRQAFSAYVRWAVEHTDAKRLCLALVRHVEFFSILDQHPGAIWDGVFVLQVFGTHKLRKYELPMRWLEAQYAVEFAPGAKRANAEAHTSRKLLTSVPAGTMARDLLQAFFDELHMRVEFGKIKPRTMRMALRPAVNLLLAASAEGTSLPDQKALDDMLENAPGQRAAVSTFLGFLKARHKVELIVRKNPSRKDADTRKKLGAQLAEIANSGRHDSKARQLWDETALRYFHRLSKGQAKEIAKTAVREAQSEGEALRVGLQVFWVPSLPWRDAAQSQADHESTI